MNDIVENLRKVESTLLEGVKLVAVTRNTQCAGDQYGY